ncbi:MAG: hypothetical protein L6Q77_10955 [Bacteroidetes bacterium]|nr:hypothetical protein [Bacteroidota bacterium]
MKADTDNMDHFPPDYSDSPLFMVIHDPVLHQFLAMLNEKKREMEASPGKKHVLQFTRGYLDSVRTAFKNQILTGENHLHQLANLLSSCFFRNQFELHSNVIGVLPDRSRPFHIRERITRDMLLSQTDLDLGNHMLGNFRYHHDAQWKSLVLSANFVEYIPMDRATHGINRITSRVKAEEEIWNKVTDELFQIDKVLRRDKQLRQYSKYIKDVFGVKIVCETKEDCQAVHQVLEQDRLIQLSWLARSRNFGEKVTPVEFVETKDYLFCPPERKKKTGWEALKSVVRWQGHTFEIQFQPLVNYYLELDHMSEPSHQSFKLNRDQVRQELSRSIPYYGFYRSLLKMIFLNREMSFEVDSVRVEITE